MKGRDFIPSPSNRKYCTVHLALLSCGGNWSGWMTYGDYFLLVKLPSKLAPKRVFADNSVGQFVISEMHSPELIQGLIGWLDGLLSVALHEEEENQLDWVENTVPAQEVRTGSSGWPQEESWEIRTMFSQRLPHFPGRHVENLRRFFSSSDDWLTDWMCRWSVLKGGSDKQKQFHSVFLSHGGYLSFVIINRIVTNLSDRITLSIHKCFRRVW